jgi:hypothetical protein
LLSKHRQLLFAPKYDLYIWHISYMIKWSNDQISDKCDVSCIIQAWHFEYLCGTHSTAYLSESSSFIVRYDVVWPSHIAHISSEKIWLNNRFIDQVRSQWANAKRAVLWNEKPLFFDVRRQYPSLLKAVFKDFSLAYCMLSSGARVGIIFHGTRLWDEDAYSYCLRASRWDVRSRTLLSHLAFFCEMLIWVLT